MNNSRIGMNNSRIGIYKNQKSESHSMTHTTSIPRISLAVPQPSTPRALHFLALEFRWDPAFAMQYDRRYRTSATSNTRGRA
jgi:hypothetical protein